MALSNHAIFGVQNTLLTECLAAMVLCAMVNVAILLEVLGATRWTRVSHDHSGLLASLVSVGGVSQP